MTHLSLSLLGTFEAKLNGQPLDGFRSDKTRALLAYLAVERDRPHSRAHLAGLLWPDWPEATARTYLRQALRNLWQILGDRQAVSPVLQVTRQSIQVNYQPNIWLDIAEIEQAVQQLTKSKQPQIHVAQRAALVEALPHYRGHFLESFFLDGCAAFEEWQLLTRERLQHQVTEALGLLVDLFIDEGDIAAALAYARQCVAYAPWQEEGHRQLIRLLAQSGEKAQALAHYETYRQIAAAQLATVPAPETTELYQQIKAGQYSVRQQQIARTALTPHIALPTVLLPAFLAMTPLRSPNRFPFVAREKELERLVSHLNKALAGQGRVIFITGDAGSGKSSLLHEFLQLAQQQHPKIIVANGNCSAHSGVGDPYLPFRELLEALTGDVETKWLAGTMTRQQIVQLWSALPSIIGNLITHGADLINSLLHGPSLLDRLSESMPAEQEALAQVRRQINQTKRNTATGIPLRQIDLFEQVTVVLQKIARSHLLLLAVDDLQWADPGSISLLFHLGRRLEGVPILIVGAYRPEEIIAGRDAERHPLGVLLHEFTRMWSDIVVDLNASDGYQFVKAFLGQLPNRLDNDFGELLWQHCAGHALFTTEMIGSLQQRGELVQDEKGYWIKINTLNWEVLPARIEAVIAERIHRLPKDLRRVLSVASVEGEHFMAEPIAQLLNMDAHDLIQSLSGELDRQHQLVRVQGVQRVGGKRLSQYRFRHSLFQNFLYKTLDDVERTYWHAAIAQVLEAYYADLANMNMSYAAQLAWHFQQAGASEKAVHYLSCAGTCAMQLFANQEAITHFANALALLKMQPETAESMHQELAIQVALGIAMGIVYGHGAPTVEQHLVRAEALASQLHDDVQLFPAAWRLWQYYHVKGQFYAAYDRALDLMRQTEQTDDILYKLAAQQAVGNTAFALGKLPVTRTQLEKSFIQLSVAEEQVYIHKFGTHPEVLSRIFLALTLCCMGYPDCSLQMINKALDLAEQIEHPFTVSFALVGALGVHLLRRDPARALAYAEKAIAFCQDQDIHQWIPHSRYVRGLAWVMLGKTSAGIEEAEQGFWGWQKTGSSLWGARMRAVFADVCLQIGDLQRVEHLITKAFEHVEQTGERLYAAELYRLQGELLWQQGQGDPPMREIEACFRNAIAIAQEQQAKLWELRATVSLSRLWHEQGKRTQAHAQLHTIYEWFTGGLDTPDLLEANALLQQLSA